MIENNYNVLFLYINKSISYVSELIYIIIHINLSSLNKNSEPVPYPKAS